MEATRNKYTLETLLPLNRSYDMEHTLTQGDVDMANRLVEAIEGSRSSQIPKIGDRMRHVGRHQQQNNLFFNEAEDEMLAKFRRKLQAKIEKYAALENN